MEDRFDALVGLIGMLNVVIDRRSAGESLAQAQRSVDGWILGTSPAGARARRDARRLQQREGLLRKEYRA